MVCKKEVTRGVTFLKREKERQRFKVVSMEHYPPRVQVPMAHFPRDTDHRLVLLRFVRPVTVPPDRIQHLIVPAPLGFSYI